MEAFVVINPNLEFVQTYNRDTDRITFTEELEKARLCETSGEALLLAKEITTNTPNKLIQVVRVHV